VVRVGGAVRCIVVSGWTSLALVLAVAFGWRGVAICVGDVVGFVVGLLAVSCGVGIAWL